MSKIILLVGFSSAIAIIAGILVVKRGQFSRWTDQTVANLRAAATSLPDRSVRETDWADLPAPVQQYFEHVLREDQPYIETAVFEQEGTFRDGEASSAPWYPFTATEHVTVRPPGFVWDARIRMTMGIPVRVLDAYHDGQGCLRAALGGAISVMDAAPTPALDEGELLRYLAEAPLYPTALLPGMGVTWTPIDEQTAQATLEDEGTTASLLFHFNDQGEVERVSGKRGFTKADGTSEYRSWKGYWHHYEERNGMQVPTEGEVAWIHPEGEVSYWQGHIRSIEYTGTGGMGKTTGELSEEM